MPRTVLVPLLIVALALAAPGAAALITPVGEPGADVGVGPRGLAAPGEPYYVLVHLRAPEAPSQGNATSCEKGDPPTLVDALVDLTMDVRDWDPRAEPRISGWYPRCFEGSFGGSDRPISGSVSYDFPTGRYVIDVDAPPGTTLPTTPVSVPIPVLPLALTLNNQLVFTGTTGVGTEADCELCPPPTG